jgi:hypothetical protein
MDLGISQVPQMWSELINVLQGSRRRLREIICSIFFRVVYTHPGEPPQKKLHVAGTSFMSNTSSCTHHFFCLFYWSRCYKGTEWRFFWEFNGTLADVVNITLRSGSIYYVSVVKDAHRVTLKQGWDLVCEDHRISYGDYGVFTYRGSEEISLKGAKG